MGGRYKPPLAGRGYGALLGIRIDAQGCERRLPGSSSSNSRGETKRGNIREPVACGAGHLKGIWPACQRNERWIERETSSVIADSPQLQSYRSHREIEVFAVGRQFRAWRDASRSQDRM